MPTRPTDDRVSVIVPVFNGARFLREAVATIRAQNDPVREIVVVDDGSTDDTPAVMAALGEQIVPIRQSNQGPAAARNAGLAASQGAVIAFLDVDDLWPAGRLSAMVERLRADPALAVVRGYVEVIQLGAVGVAPEKPSGPMLGPWLGSAVYRRSVFTQVGLFDPGLRFSEDLDWFFRAREQQVPICVLQRTVLQVRRHDRNMTLGLDCHDLNVLRVLKRSLDRRRGAITKEVAVG